MYRYKAYALNINSEIEFHEFQANNNDSDFDIDICIGDTPHKLEGKEVINKVRYQTGPNELLYHLKGAGRIYVSGGNKIVVQPIDNPDWEHLKNHVRARGIAAALHQRKHAILHGSAICKDGMAILFIGRSGAGKSTSLAAFIKRGYDYIADDLCLIKSDKYGACRVIPAYPKLRLWGDTIKLVQAGDQLRKGEKIREDIDKYFMFSETKFIEEALPISHIYILSAYQGNDINVSTVENLDKLNYLMQNSFAKGHLEGLGGYNEQFRVYGDLIKQASIKKIERPLGGGSESLWNLIDLVESDFLNDFSYG